MELIDKSKYHPPKIIEHENGGGTTKVYEMIRTEEEQKAYIKNIEDTASRVLSKFYNDNVKATYVTD